MICFCSRPLASRLASPRNEPDSSWSALLLYAARGGRLSNYPTLSFGSNAPDFLDPEPQVSSRQDPTDHCKKVGLFLSRPSLERLPPAQQQRSKQKEKHVFFALLDPEIPWVAFYCNGKSLHVHSESFAHSDGCESSRLMLVADAVEPDLRAVRR